MADANFTQKSENSNDSYTALMLGGGIVAVLLLALVLNYFNFFPLSQSYPSAFGWLPHQTQSAVTQKEQVNVKSSPLIEAQSALIDKAQITEIGSNTISVKKQDGTSDILKLSANLQVRKYIEGQQEPLVSQGVGEIEKLRDVRIILQVENQEYKVVSITYFAPTE